MTSSDHWPLVRLRDVIDLTLSSVDKKTKPGEIPVRLCNYMDVYKNQFIHDHLDFMPATATEREISRCSLYAGDVVITKDSEKYDDIGVPALVTADLSDLVCGYHLAILRPSTSELDGAFLFYALSAPQVQQQFHAYANGVTRFGLRKADIGLVEIPFPPLDEQRRIARILGALDDKIELNRRMSETLEAMARALFQSWFVDFDPVRAKAEGRPTGLPPALDALFPDSFQESELGEIPTGWKVAPVSQALDIYGGSTPSTKESSYWGGEHCFATPKDLSKLSEPFLATTARRLKSAGVAQVRSGLLPIGTVLLSSRAPIGYLAVTETPVVINQGIIGMVCDGPVGAQYVLHWTRANMQAIEERASGTTFAEISKSSFREIPFLVPSESCHAAWQSFASPLGALIASNARQSRRIAVLRDTVMRPMVAEFTQRSPERGKRIRMNSQYHSRISQLEKEIAVHDKAMAALAKQESDSVVKRNRASLAMNKTSSVSALRSKTSEYERETKRLADIEKKRSDISTKRANAAKKLRDYQRRQADADKQARQKEEREQRKLMREREAHQRRMQQSDAISTWRSQENSPSTLPAESNRHFDFFICHASEDKDDVVRDLVGLLKERGAQVWYDEFTLSVGSRLRRAIEHGLASSRFGVVIVSEHFFAKDWPQRELDGLFSLDSNGPNDGTESRILPVWHKVTRDEVRRRSPILADLVALNTSILSKAEIADELCARLPEE